MSAQDMRNAIIRKNLPNLLKALTGFQEDDENYIRCKHFALSILRNYRTISTNSHEIRRKIDSMREKFKVDNLIQEAELLYDLCEEIIHHPLCTTHYELDIQWSLIDLLLSLAYNPTRSLRKNPNRFSFKVSQQTEKELPPTDLSYWLKILKEDVESLERNDKFEESSDWSIDESGISMHLQDDGKFFKEPENSLEISKSNILPLKGEFSQNIVCYEESFSKNPLQNSWWQKTISKVTVDNKLIVSNFGFIFNNFLNERYFQSKRHFIEISTEYSLIREILWMFHKPLDCRFFQMKNGVLQLKENFTIPSVTSDVLKIYVENAFLPYIRMMNILNEFINLVYTNESGRIPKTFMCYAATLRTFLKDIWKDIINAENKMMKPDSLCYCTIISLEKCLHSTFSFLNAIYDLHQYIVLDFQKYPPHVLTMYMLVRLLNFLNVAAKPSHSNLAGSVFMTVSRVYCQILDKWWSEASLDDSENELIVESAKNEMFETVYIRSTFSAFPKRDTKSVLSSRLFRMLVEHCSEAGSILSLLYRINRISELRKVTGVSIGTLYETFVREVLQTFHIVSNSVELNRDLTNSSFSKYQLNVQDEYLALAFDFDTQASTKTNFGKEIEDCFAQKIYRLFESFVSFLPLEEVFLKVLKRNLKMRIRLADSFVIKMFIKEFALITHLRNIRYVMLLEASDIMFQFYSQLFKKIESKEEWANSYLLTSDLNDLLCSRYSDMNALFTIDVHSNYVFQSEKVCQALDGVFIRYNVPRELSYIITPQAIDSYNNIFQFLLKVKWGLITLENMKFSKNSRRHLSYEIGELLMRRLEQLRFWMIHDLQIIHFHLTSNVLESLGLKLDEHLSNCKNFKEIITAHKTYLDTLCTHCCQMPNLATIKLGIEQLISLVFLLRADWQGCSSYLQSLSPLSTTLDDTILDNDYIVNNQVDSLEFTFVQYHQYLANHLNKEVYINQNDFLSGLNCAFNASLPY